ncbi:MAG: DNA internalization-related competence protein ComEC/Rec2 [Candidatus Saganbacteria bacterium]|nr:DNA internalization-related competence protein ComEC/Rec2 [Candidatus Saganbacteria bacterium]
MGLRSQPLPTDHIANLPAGQNAELRGVVVDQPKQVGDRQYFTLKIERVNGEPLQGLIAVKTCGQEALYGDELIVCGKLVDVDGLANPGILSFAEHQRAQGIHKQLLALRSPPKKIAGNRASRLMAFCFCVRERLLAVPRLTLPEPYATLLASIVFGSQAAATPVEIKEAYKRAGVAHLLVASGMHLGILIGVCLFLVKACRVPLGAGVILTTIVNFLYALMAGFGPSILRAAIMAEIMLAGLLFEREKEVYTSLAISGLIILLFWPNYLFHVGFQLSFGATWSLVYVAPVIYDWLKDWLPRLVSVTLSASIAPVLASVPVTLYHFSQASLIGLLSNVLLLPWVGFIVVLGFIAAVLGAVWLPLGELVNSANLVLLWLAHHLITGLAGLPFAQIFSAPPSLALITGYYLALCLTVELLRRRRWPRLTLIRYLSGSLILLALIVWHIFLTWTVPGLCVTFLDVGQGDAVFILTPAGRTVLIDAGDGGMGEKIVVPFLRRHGVAALDLVILTHAHDDHVGGLPEVLAKIKVRNVLEPGVIYNSQAYRNFRRLVEANRIRYTTGRAGQKIVLGDGVTLDILHPTPGFAGNDMENLNNTSVVCLLSYGSFKVMLTGDNEHEGEAEILRHYRAEELRATVLKAGHHGSSTSTSAEWLRAVQPALAVISCGSGNKFRHPHSSTLAHLTGAGVVVLRTDLQGAVTVTSDGVRYSWVTEKQAGHCPGAVQPQPGL